MAQNEPAGPRPERENSRPPSSDKILERVPPHDVDAEAAVLGSMLMDAQAAEVALEDLQVDDFYQPRHKVTFSVFKALFESHEHIDELFLCSELERRGKLAEAGGREAISRLILHTPSPAGIEGYCRVVRDRAIERELLLSAGRILQSVNEPSAGGSQELVEQAEKLVYDIAERRSAQAQMSMAQLMTKVLTEARHAAAERRAGRPIPCPAISTGYADLDRLLSGGLWPGELIVIGGRPGMGKTTFALNIVRKISVGNENNIKPTAVFSMEMPAEQISKNIVCAEAKLDGMKLRKNDLNDEEVEQLEFYSKAMETGRISIDDTSGLTISALRSRCRRLCRRQNVRLVVIDYLQLMRGASSFGNQNREQQVSEISRGLKTLALELKIPIIVLSQLNRSAESRENKDKRPQLSDLRESGAIEQDADVVIMLYRKDYWEDETTAQTSTSVLQAMVLKNRNGATGQAKLTFFRNFLRFDSYLPEDDAAAGE